MKNKFVLLMLLAGMLMTSFAQANQNIILEKEKPADATVVTKTQTDEPTMTAEAGRRGKLRNSWGTNCSVVITDQGNYVWSGQAMDGDVIEFLNKLPGTTLHATISNGSETVENDFVLIE